jgi:hypothetical protein
MKRNPCGDTETGGNLVPIALALGAVIIACGHRSGDARLVRLGRELRGDAARAVIVRRTPAPRLAGSSR